jgi:hypothetical protein
MTAAGGGAAGVSVSLAVVVAGSRLSQDAHDVIYTDNGESGDDSKQVTHDYEGNTYFVYTDGNDHYYYTLGDGFWYSLGYKLEIYNGTPVNPVSTNQT